MGKSPKPTDQGETGAGGKKAKGEDGFSFGIDAEEVEATGSDFSNDMPTPFDNYVGQDEQSNRTELPESGQPATTLALPAGGAGSGAGRKSPQKMQRASMRRAAGAGAPKQQSDPDKLSDALLSAGVDIKEEEALLSSTVTTMKSNSQVSNSQIPLHPPFLHPSHVASMMKKVAAEQNFNQDFSKSSELLSLMSTACELYIRDIITNSIIISRHRRKAVKLNSGRRSETTRVLRDLALKQREQEERRVKRRIALGLEKEITDPKLDSGETLHRASNATANMMIAGGKKKYSWLTSGSKVNSTDLKNPGKVSSAVAARGDLGIKFREAREEPGIVMRDLLHALENRRVGVNNTIAKGYARIRD
ncbi:AaceriACL016Cp [[Ashbya] aceris (nom. inval.)]|nr:AaceriACL016Cp [[Ashbya] aceris (nom. inval.)]